MKYIVTFYSHFGAIRFKREAPTTWGTIQLMPVPRDLSLSCGTCAVIEVEGTVEFAHQQYHDIEQIVRVTGDGYEVLCHSDK
ncbi:putative Se/S carrier-like protein [Veillonella caviae]|uniref:putative Se/S carrier-like protein n=1 Tax=Veillonella caviae TaxID=248316 RepID=UPI0023F95225|nr:putative Se/S carrier-like protein [Veillonella caviae]